ncbi:MAG: SusC/RagA family TonB-linked outer membrane protein [Saprospiraceae bacterium]
MKRLSLLSSMLLVAIFSFGQRAITGKVTDNTGEALIGANVAAKGTTVGTVTDIDGSYTINVPDNVTVLVFTYTGFTTQEVLFGDRTQLDIIMQQGVAIEEIVVTAQGISREKRALGYSVATVNAKKIEDRPQPDIGRVLQGKVPGLNITSTSGATGTGTNITIRGYTSITGSNQPLFVVDGVPFNSSTNQRGGFTSGGQNASSRFLDLDPNSIESVSVLKGLAATVTYGDQGRNGVILVTTKNGSGKTRVPQVTLTQSYFTNTAHLPKYQDDYVGGFQQNLGYFFSNWGPTIPEALIYPSQNTNSALTTHPYANLSNAALRAGQAEYVASLGAYKMKVFPNNVSDFFRTGQISNTSLNVSGGGDKVGYNVSAGYNTEQGYIPNNNLKKINVGLGLNAQISNRLKLITSINFANTDLLSPPLNAGTGNNTLGGFPSVLANVLYTPRQVDLIGWPFEDPATGKSVYYRSGNDIPNPNWILKNYATTDVVNRIFSSTSLNYNIAKGFDFLYRIGLDRYNEAQEARFNKGGVDFPNGFYGTRDIENTIWDNSAIFSYSKELTSKIEVSAKFGGNIRNDKYNEIGVGSQNQLARGLYRHSNFIDNSAGNFYQEQTRMGLLGEVSADYGNYFFINFAGRNDWTSTVEKANRRIFYPSVSVSFIPSTMIPGLKSPFLNFLKIRAGYGTSAGFPDPYNTRSILDQNARAFLNANGSTVQTHSTNNLLGNPNLKPELHKEVELGVEGKIFNERVDFDVTFYNRRTQDLITSSPLDASTGYTATTINLGAIRNTGAEISLSGAPVSNRNFVWDVSAVFSRNVPKVLDLGGTLEEVQVTGFGNALGNYAIVGKPFNIIKGTGNLRNDAGQLLIDGQGYPIATSSPIILGDPNPAFITSLGNTFSYKSLSLNVMFSYRHGGAMYSSTAGALMGRGLTYDTGLEAGYDRSQTYLYPGVKASDGSPNNIQVTASDVGFNTKYFFTDEGRIYDGSTIRLQELSLSYSLPKSLMNKLKMKGASIGFTGNNIWYKAIHFPPGLNFDTDNLGLGVGNGLGFEFLTGPSSRRLGATLKLNF